MRQTAATESSVVLAWTPSTDNVGVVEYGLYASGIRVTTVERRQRNAHRPQLRQELPDRPRRSRRRRQPLHPDQRLLQDLRLPVDQQATRHTHRGQGHPATDTTVALSWTASTDDVAVTGYGLYLSGSRTSETTGTTGQFTGLKCGTTYTLGVDAKDAAGLRSAPATLSTATSPCTTPPPPPSSTGSITQTIANGATVKGVVNWYAVYDGNGDKVEDDPGGSSGVLTATSSDRGRVPFGDDASFWASTSVANGTHTFEVRAVNGSGTVLAKNTVTATVANTTTTPPPPSSTGSITQTIANGATVKGVVNWRARLRRQRRQGRGRPGKVEWRVDGNLVRTEVDSRSVTTPASGPSTSVANGIAHVRGARCQRLRHRARQEHRHRDRRQHHHPAAAELDGLDHADDRERCDGEGCRELVCASTTATATRSRTTREGRVACRRQPRPHRGRCPVR